MRRASAFAFVTSIALFHQPSLAAEPIPVSPSAKAPLTLSESLVGQDREQYEAGKLAFQSTNYAGALIFFEAVYRRVHDPRLLWNMAACNKALARYARMQDVLRLYIAEGKDVISETERDQAKAAIVAVDALVVRARVQSNVDGSDVYVDDDRIGRTPLTEPLRLDVGEHRVRAMKEGYVDFIERVSVGSQRVMTLNIKMIAKPLLPAHLVVLAGPEQTIAIDGRTVGTGQWDGTVSPTRHRVLVTGKGMNSYANDVSLRPGEEQKLYVKLERRSNLATWLWIAGSVALAGGVATTVYFATRSTGPGTVQTKDPDKSGITWPGGPVVMPSFPIPMSGPTSSE